VNTKPEPARPVRSWPALIESVLADRDLTESDTAWVMDRIMRGEASDALIAGFLVALRAKGETVGELEGLVRGMLAHAVPVEVSGRTVDVVGTGGDGAHTVNISTMAAVVTAGAGARVVKHGNRAASSASGSADVLESLGVRLRLEPRRVAELVDEVGITFCFAPDFHPAMRHAVGARRALAIPTVFNALGPLTNPARPSSQAVGVADPRLLPLVAGVLARRAATALVFRGDDGLDELTLSTTSTVLVVEDGAVREERVDPRQLGFGYVPVEALRGAGPEHNADVARRVFAGEMGPVRDAVLLSAAAALAALEPSAGRTVTERLAAELPRAAWAVDSGAAQETLRKWTVASAAEREPAVQTA